MKSPAPLPPPPPPAETTTHLLEINLISAQNLKPPSTPLRKLQTFAEVFISSSTTATKLRTRVDRVGGENPNWNDKFIFRVSNDFLSSETSSFTVEIFSVGVVKHTLLGTVRCLLGNFPTPIPIGVNCCVALQVRRPSGRFHGVLNVGVMAIHGSSEVGFTLSGVSALGFRDFMGDSAGKNRRHRKHHQRNVSDFSSGSGGDSFDFSDGAESTESNSSTASGPSSILRELNGRREKEMAGKDGKEGVILCGLGFQKKVHSPDVKSFGALDLESH